MLSEFRKSKSTKRFELREQQKIELIEIRSTRTGSDRVAAISIVKMQHAAALSEFSETTRSARSALYKSLDATAPGATFRIFLVQQAQAGDEAALNLVRQYGANEATSVSRQSEASRLNIVASLSGFDDKLVSRLSIKHRVESNGTVIFDFGEGRIVTDSAIAKQILLNAAAANDAVAIETSLRFAVSRFGNPLTLTGTAEFQRLAVETAAHNGSFIKFSDPALEQYRINLSEKNFTSPTLKEKQHVEHTQKYRDQRKPSSHTRDSLYRLPEFDLDSKPASHEMLLQGDVPGGLAQLDRSELQRRRFGVRRPAPTEHGIGKISIGSKPHSYRRATPVIATEQERGADEQQESIRFERTHVQRVASPASEVKNPVPQNVQLGTVATQKNSKAER